MKRTLLTALLAIAVSSFIFGQTKDSKSDDALREKEALLKLTDELTSAKIKLDTAKLDRILADDYVLTNPAGLFANKAEYLEGTKADTATYESVTNYDQVVKIYGDAAVVAGRTTVKGRYDGHDIGGEFRFTNVFVKRQSGWQCVATHLTRIAQR